MLPGLSAFCVNSELHLGAFPWSGRTANSLGAALLAVKLRMRSVQNIGKITSAMKMVAASKMRLAQLATENSRGITYPILKLLGDHPGAPAQACTSATGSRP